MVARETAEEYWEGNEIHLSFPDDPYQLIKTDILKNGLVRVYDIGSSYGPHIGVMLDAGLEYVGIDSDEDALRWNIEDSIYDCQLLLGRPYPFELLPPQGSVAISVCCIGTDTHSGKPESDEKMVEMIVSEFSHFYCHTWSDSIKSFCKYWKHCEILYVDTDFAGGCMTAHFYN